MEEEREAKLNIESNSPDRWWWNVVIRHPMLGPSQYALDNPLPEEDEEWGPNPEEEDERSES